MRENSDCVTKINEINVELSGNSQRYVNECCESESDGKIDGFSAGCCKWDALNALMHKYPPCPLTITSTKVTTNPPPDGNAAQDTTLPDAPTTTAPAVKDRWKTGEGKEVWKKRWNEQTDNKPAATTMSNTPKMKTGGRGKNTHQLKPMTPSAKKTWAEVIKSGGINVQIVLGNGNLGLATSPMKKRGERQGGVACRLGRKEGVGERGEK
jgi:hypothetical protein